MSDSPMHVTRFRQRLPLRPRLWYGTLTRRLRLHPVWDHPAFIALYEELLKSQWWSLGDLQAMQLEKLKALVKHAYEQTPFYRQLYDAQGITPDTIQSLADVQKLPIITRQDVREHREDMVTRDCDRHLLAPVTTSGSTGEPLGIYHDREMSELSESAYILRQWGWAGYRFGDRYASLRGQIIRLVDRNGKIRMWDYNTLNNQLVLLAQDTSLDTLTRAAQLLQVFKPRFLYTYPSTLEILARYLQAQAIDNIRVEATFAESETLYPHQRTLIEAQFGGKVFGGYGHSERTVDAVECDHHTGYHVCMEYGLLELTDDAGEVITEPGQLGRVVGTGFDTHHMPMIRYETDDLALYAMQPCGCGRALTLIEDFKGRIPEYLVTKAGQIVPFSPVYASLGDEMPEIWAQIREARFVQPSVGHLIAEIAVAPEADSAAVCRQFQRGLNDWVSSEHFDIAVQLVDEVPRNSRGKIKYLEQQLPISLRDVISCAERNHK